MRLGQGLRCKILGIIPWGCSCGGVGSICMYICIQCPPTNHVTLVANPDRGNSGGHEKSTI